MKPENLHLLAHKYVRPVYIHALEIKSVGALGQAGCTLTFVGTDEHLSVSRDWVDALYPEEGGFVIFWAGGSTNYASAAVFHTTYSPTEETVEALAQATSATDDHPAEEEDAQEDEEDALETR